MPHRLNDPCTEWRIGYGKFFAAKVRRWVLAKAELPASARPFRLFTTSNDTISSFVRAAGAYEPEVLGLIAQLAQRYGLSKGIALDIGANIGNHAVWLARHFNAVVAFEPSPWVAAVLRANTLLNGCENVQVVEVALAEAAGHGTLVARRADNIGMLELEEHGRSALGSPPAANVRLDTGDAVLQGLGLLDRPVTFVKLDIEGAEVRALKGLHQTLCRDQPLLCFESRNAAEGCAIEEALRKAGYSHFNSVVATRLSIGEIIRPWRLLPLTKRYSLRPLQLFENRHYPAVFAWNREFR